MICVCYLHSIYIEKFNCYLHWVYMVKFKCISIGFI